jgi:serine/threonine-protein kinase
MSATPSGELATIGRYEIIKTLGRGAMGVVYKARDPLLDRIVAVKTIGSPKGVGKRVRAAYLERFEREAKAAAKMQHPAIVTIFDVGLDDGAPFMVLEYLPGETLADRLDRVRLPLGKVISTAIDLGSALGFAHKQRIVHRDMKPANVLHAGEDRWKLADFGIARLPDSDLTQVGIFMGTPGYSPPEAIREGRYTPQADVFAWGAVLYELLSGYIPYEGPDTQTTNSYVLKGTAKSPKHYDPSIPDPLAEVTMRSLSPDTSLRFKDGSEAETALRKAWEHCLRHNLVLPSSLAGDEVPHERVGAEMHSHSGYTGVGPAPAAPAKAGVTEADAPALVIESSDRGSDDDPTTIMIREGDSVIEDLRSLSITEDVDDTGDPTTLAKKKNSSEPSQEARYETAIGGKAGAGGRVWIAALLMLLAIGGAVALYATGYLP